MLSIDGSYGEGGGQILRTSIALAAVLGESIEIKNIRAKRRNPGLRNQHLWGIKLVAMMTRAHVEGLKIGSTRLLFSPGEIKGGEYKIDIGTAGSITLLLQTSLLPALFADREVVLDIRGGTDVPWSPPVDYYRYVLFPLLRKMGADLTMEVLERGYYPEGGGKVKLRVTPASLKGIGLEERGELRVRRAFISLRNLPHHIVERMKKNIPGYVVVEDARNTGISRGCSLLLVNEFTYTLLGSDSLCRKGLPAEKVAKIAVDKMEREIRSRATVDVNMADHLLPFGFLARSKTVYYAGEITEHTRTNAWVIEKFGGKVKIVGNRIEVHA